MPDNQFRIYKPYLRGLPIIVLFILIGVIASKKYLNYVTPVYESTAKIKLADKGEGTPGSNLFKDLDVFATSNKIAAEIEILKSEVLLNKVFTDSDFNLDIKRIGKIKNVSLYHNSPIKISYGTLKHNGYDKSFSLEIISKTSYLLSYNGLERAIKGNFDLPVNTEFGNMLIELNDSLIRSNPKQQLLGNYEFEILSNQKLFQQISKNLDIMSVDKDVAVIRISYKDANPLKAANLVNRLAEVYIQDYIETKYKAANITVNFLDEQIDAVMEKVTSSENEIENYRDQNSITNISQETETDLRKLSQLKIQKTNLKMSLDAIQDLEQYVNKGKDNFLDLAPNFEAFTDLLSTEIVKKIQALKAEKKDLLIVYTPEDEKVKVIDYKIKDLTDYLRESIKNTRNNLEIKYKDLALDINLAEAVFKGVPEKEKMLNILNREFAIYQHSYNFLNEKRIEAKIAQSVKIAFHRIISKGEISKQPVSPNRNIIVIVSAIIAMFISIIAIYFVHHLKAKVNDAYTIESNSNIPIASLTPKLLSSIEIKKHFLKEAIQLEIKGLIEPHAVVNITSFDNKEGAKFNAINLSRAMSLQGRNLLLIDVENQLNLFKEVDQEMMIDFETYRVISLCKEKYNLYTKDKMIELFTSLKYEFEYIIVLNESLKSDTKSKLIMSVSDVNLLVLDTRLTPKKSIIETDLLQREFNFPNMQFILNRNLYSPSLFGEIKKCVRKITNILNLKNTILK